MAAEIEADESTIDRMLRLMRRKRKRDDAADNGTWLGLGQIKQMVGGCKETNRGLLIKLVARGDVEVSVCANGTYWRAYQDEKKKAAFQEPVRDGEFILQRELVDERRGLLSRHAAWFDAETFTNSEIAKAALQFAQWEAQHRAKEWDRRVQRIRIVRVDVA